MLWCTNFYRLWLHIINVGLCIYYKDNNSSTKALIRWWHGFWTKASLPLTQDTSAITRNTTRLCWFYITGWEYQIHTDAASVWSWSILLYFHFSIDDKLICRDLISNETSKRICWFSSQYYQHHKQCLGYWTLQPSSLIPIKFVYVHKETCRVYLKPVYLYTHKICCPSVMYIFTIGIRKKSLLSQKYKWNERKGQCFCLFIYKYVKGKSFLFNKILPNSSSVDILPHLRHVFTLLSKYACKILFSTPKSSKVSLSFFRV